MSAFSKVPARTYAPARLVLFVLVVLALSACAQSADTPSGDAGTPTQTVKPSPRATATPGSHLPAADASCKDEGQTQSNDAVGPTTFTIANHTDVALTVYWLNYTGQREKWFALAPGAAQKQETFKTHPWLVAGPGGACLMIFSAPAKIVVD